MKNISIPGVQPGLITKSPRPQIKESAAAPSFGFSEALAAVNTATEDQAQKIRDTYGLTVGIAALTADEQDIAKRAAGGGLPEVVIAPNILQQMSRNPATKRKVYGYLDNYINDDTRSLEQIEQRHGVKVAGRSLIIHKDGTYTVWPAMTGSHEEVMKGGRAGADQHKRIEAQAPAAKAEAESALPGKQPVTQPGEPALPAAIRALSSRDLLKLSLLIRNSKSDKR